MIKPFIPVEKIEALTNLEPDWKMMYYGLALIIVKARRHCKKR